MLPSIFKIIEEKIKYLLTLKNIRNISSLQYYQWISILKYWQRFFDFLIEEHSLLNFKPNPNTAVSPLIHELTEIVLENMRRAINAMNLKALLLDLTVDYINVFHNVNSPTLRTPSKIKSLTPSRKTLGSPLKSHKSSQTS